MTVISGRQKECRPECSHRRRTGLPVRPNRKSAARCKCAADNEGRGSEDNNYIY